MPIDDYSSDKADATPNAVTSPGKYVKIAVPDFMNSGSANGLGTYLRLGAVEDVTKAGKGTGTAGLVVDFDGNALAADPNAVLNPGYDPLVDFGRHNLPADGRTPIPPGTTPQSPPKDPTAPANPTAAQPDPTGEDLAALVQGFADDSRNRGKAAHQQAINDRGKVTKKGSGGKAVDVHVNTPGGQPRDPNSTAQGPLFGYPWVTPVTDAKAPGQDTGLIKGVEVPSKPPFHAKDYRTLESSQLHTKGGWRDHTDGNRITTTRGDKIEVIRGNYKLIVLGRQDQTKPKLAGMDISGGQQVTGSGDLAADASTDFHPGSTAFSSLFEWRQAVTDKSVPPSLAKAVGAEFGAALAEAEAKNAADKLAADEPTKLREEADAARKLAQAAGYAAELAAQKSADAATLVTASLTAQQNAAAAAAAVPVTAAPAARAAAAKAAKEATTAANNAASTASDTNKLATTYSIVSTDLTAIASLAEGVEQGKLALAKGASGKDAGTAAALGAQGIWEGTAPSAVQKAIADAAVAVAVNPQGSTTETEKYAALAAAQATANLAATTTAGAAATAAQEQGAGYGSSDAASATTAAAAAGQSGTSPSQAQLTQAAATAKAQADAAAAAAKADPNNAAKAAAAQTAAANYDTAEAAAVAGPANAEKTSDADKNALATAKATLLTDQSKLAADILAAQAAPTDAALAQVVIKDQNQVITDMLAVATAQAALAADLSPTEDATPHELLHAARVADKAMQDAAAAAAAAQAQAIASISGVPDDATATANAKAAQGLDATASTDAAAAAAASAAATKDPTLDTPATSTTPLKQGTLSKADQAAQASKTASTAAAEVDAAAAGPANATTALTAASATALPALTKAISASQKAWTAYAPVLATEALLAAPTNIDADLLKALASKDGTVTKDSAKNAAALEKLMVSRGIAEAILQKINKDPASLTPYDVSTASATLVKAAATAAAAAAVGIAAVKVVNAWSKETPKEKAKAAKAKTDAAAAAKADAAAAKAAARAEAIEMDMDISPLMLLGITELTSEEDPDADYRSVSTAKKGSGPKIQLKYQRAPASLVTSLSKKRVEELGYDQDPSWDGRTYALPDMRTTGGLGINETWAYVTVNYTGIGYYPITRPEPWDDGYGPPPPKTQTQSADKTQMIDPPARKRIPQFPDTPELQIFPSWKTVGKTYAWNTSAETYVNRTVTITAGPRLPDPADLPEHKRSEADRRAWAEFPTKTYKHAPTTYDRDLLHSKDVSFFDVFPFTPMAWVLGQTALKKNIPDFTKIAETWSETHVQNATTISRAGTTVSDTVVEGQYSMTHANVNMGYTKLGYQHTVTQAGSTYAETDVGTQETHTNVGHSISHTKTGTQYQTSMMGASLSMSLAGTTNALSFTGAASSISGALLSLSVKAILAELTISLGLFKLDISPKIAFKSEPCKVREGLTTTMLEDLRTLCTPGGLEVNSPAGKVTWHMFTQIG